MKQPLSRLLLAAVATACATTGADGEGDRDLPSAGVGPFRKLADAEVLGIAPFVLEDRDARYREPSAVAVSDGVVLFAVASGADGRDAIVRSRADDGRSFFGTTGDGGRRPPVVLAPELAWEGTALSGPSILRRGEEWWLYYAGAAGIGLARSRDGLAFTREPSPVLAADPSAGGWETSAPRAPGAYVLPDGRIRLLYAAGTAIGEAESDDGVHFRRLDARPDTPALDPVLAASHEVVPASGALPARWAFDARAVSDPVGLRRVTAAGRVHLRVLYTGESPDGATAIGLAARYGDDGPLERNASPVYAAGQRERAPAVAEVSGVTLLYVGQDRRVDATRTAPGIACAVAPANVLLPAPAPYPPSP